MEKNQDHVQDSAIIDDSGNQPSQGDRSSSSQQVIIPDPRTLADTEPQTMQMLMMTSQNSTLSHHEQSTAGPDGTHGASIGVSLPCELRPDATHGVSIGASLPCEPRPNETHGASLGVTSSCEHRPDETHGASIDVSLQCEPRSDETHRAPLGVSLPCEPRSDETHGALLGVTSPSEPRPDKTHGVSLGASSACEPRTHGVSLSVTPPFEPMHTLPKPAESPTSKQDNNQVTTNASPSTPLTPDMQSLSSPIVRHSPPEPSNCNWRVPPKKRVDIDLDVRMNHTPKDPERIRVATNLASSSQTSPLTEGSEKERLEEFNGEDKKTKIQEPESIGVAKNTASSSHTTPLTEGSEKEIPEEFNGEDKIQDYTNTAKVNNKPTLGEVQRLKMLHSRRIENQKRVRPHICGICKLVIWGHLRRFQIHLKLHKKCHFRSKRRQMPPTKGFTAKKTKEPKVKKEPEPVVKVKEEPKSSRPKRVIKSRSKPERKPPKKSSKRKTKAKKAPKGNDDDDEMVSIPIPKEPSSLYLCAKCCVGFSDVMALVGHVATCTGAPKDTPSNQNTSHVNKRKSSSKKKIETKLKLKIKSEPDVKVKIEPGLTESKSRIKSERIKSREAGKVKSKKRQKSTKKRNVKVQEIVSTSGRKPRIVLRRVQGDTSSDEDADEGWQHNSDVDDGNDIDWAPSGNDGGVEDDEIQSAPMRIRIKREKVPHICEVCGASFKQELALKRHTKKHLVPSHKCEICSEIFERIGQLRAHFKKDHPDAPAPVRTPTGSPGNIECPTCHKMFRHKSALFRHKMLHTGARNHECEFCKMKFTQSCHMKQHVKKVHMHKETDEYICKPCELVFPSKDEYKTHIEGHAEENPFECEVCKARFKQQCTLEKHHVMVHEEKPATRDSITKCTCHQCGKTFNHISSYKRHKLIHLGIKKFECSQCSRRFSQKCHMKYHRCDGTPYHSRAGGRDFFKSSLCMLCGKSFASASGRRQHELSVHAASKDFKCPTCGKGFATSGHLNVHLSGAHGVGNHLCHQCGKSFSFKSSYLRHQKFHTGSKPYKCKYCERSFSQSSHCKAHEMTHEVVDKLECEFCGKRFKNPRNHKHHVRINHGKNCEFYKCFRCGEEFQSKVELSTHMAEKCYHVLHNTVCKICQKVFPTNSHLVRHMRVHTQERPFKCDLCEKSFTQNAHLKSHIARHNKIKPWQCEICGRSYASRDYLKQHVKKFHEEQPDGTIMVEKRKKRTDCELCGKKYKSRKYLIVHQKKKHGDAALLLKRLTEPLASEKRVAKKEEPSLDLQAHMQPLQPQAHPVHPAQVVIPNVSSDKLQNMVIYPQIPVEIQLPNTSAGSIPLHQAPNTSTAGLTFQVQLPQTSTGVPLQGQHPPGTLQLPPEMHPKEEQRRPEDAQQGNNMIADSMRLITVNWW